MSSVRRVSIVRQDPDGGTTLTTLYERKKRKRKKASRGLKGAERMVHHLAKAEDRFSNAYLEAHEKSNRKKKDGWLRDLDDNVYRATRKGAKKIKLRKLVGL